MHVGLRFRKDEDADLIKDVERFTNNKKFNRSDRIKDLMRLGQKVESGEIGGHNAARAPESPSKRSYPTKTLPLGKIPVEYVELESGSEEPSFEDMIAGTSFKV